MPPCSPLKKHSLVVLLVTVLTGFFSTCSAKKFLHFEPLRRDDVDRSIAEELAGNVSQQRLQDMERKMRVVYGALPKNDFGRLNHQAVRYVLHRFFVQQHGWYIRGLEPNGVAQNPNKLSGPLQDWVAAYTQERFEENARGIGTDLKGLAALATTLEDLIRKEAAAELEEIYKVMGLPMSRRIPYEEAEQAIRSYMMIFLTNRNVSLSSRKEAVAKLQIFGRKYKAFAEADAFMTGVEKRYPELFDSAGVRFSTASSIVADMGEHFGTFNDGECKELKSTLMGMSSSSGKVGRIRLHDFYNKSLYTHWKFTEKAEFLRTLGALDESVSSQPSVIIPNYLSAFTNCLRATSLYAVCCRNECEDLIGHLEREIAGPTAPPELVAELVSTLPSATVSAPRQLSEPLLRRLLQMAKANDGEIYLHGRLFAQWMHHAFPLECPYPHEAGTTSPQTAAEWMERTGGAAHATEEEMRKVVADACANGRDHGEEEAAAGSQELALPWSDAEELLVARPEVHRGRGRRVVCATASMLAAIAAVVLKLFRPALLGHMPRLLQALLFTSLLAALCAVDLLDLALFSLLALALALLGAANLLAAFPGRCAAKPEKCNV